MNDIIFMSNNLARFAKDESPPDVALTNKLFSPKIRKDPLGTVLIIGYTISDSWYIEWRY
jgi:beta-apo-4'-carotenal oxygenase